jgi:hypothetical protein
VTAVSAAGPRRPGPSAIDQQYLQERRQVTKLRENLPSGIGTAGEASRFVSALAAAALH